MDNRFTIVGPRPIPSNGRKKTKKINRLAVIAPSAVLSVIILGCIFCHLFISYPPSYMDLHNADTAPCREFLFGTDAMGRDIFSMVWYGGRISLLIGFLSASVSVICAIIIGAVAGLASMRISNLIMRLTEIFLSIPDLLLVILIQAVLGGSNILSMSLAIGLTGWAGMAKVISTQVRQIRNSGYVTASRCMGAGFVHILFKHLIPGFMPSVAFMAVMNVRTAIASEAALSFIGLGLPVETVSWGSMLSLAERSMLSGSWWIIIIPGLFLIATLICITNIAGILRKNAIRNESNL